MLWLTRKHGEEVVISTSDGEIRIRLDARRPSKIRVGVEAPDHVPVHRAEIHEQIVAEAGRVQEV